MLVQTVDNPTAKIFPRPHLEGHTHLEKLSEQNQIIALKARVAALLAEQEAWQNDIAAHDEAITASETAAASRIAELEAQVAALQTERRTAQQERPAA